MSEYADLEISPAELREELASPTAPLLVDVRKPWEYDFCHIEGSILLPLDMLPHRAGELSADRPIVTICHVGMRSLMAADYLCQLGYQARSLSGGVDQWSTEIDPSMPRY